MTFKQYLQAIESDNFENWIMENMTNKGKFSKYKVHSIIKEAISEGVCPVDKFNILRDPDDAVFGQFMYLEQQITSNEKTPNKLLNIASYILRPISDKVFDNEDTYKEEKHISDVLDEDCQNVLRVINKYIDSREHYIGTKYKGVFYKVRDEDDTDKDEDDNVDNEDDNMYWYSLVRILSKEDIHKYGDTLMLPMSIVSPEVFYLRREEQKVAHEAKIAELKRKVKSGAY